MRYDVTCDCVALSESKMADEKEVESLEKTIENTATEEKSDKMEKEKKDRKAVQKISDDFFKCVKSVFDPKFSSGGDERDSPAKPQELHKKAELKEILSEVTNLINHEKATTRYTCQPDLQMHTSIQAQSLASYLSLLDETWTRKLAACVKSDVSHWLAKLFSFENAAVCFHEHQWEGLVRVCRLALQTKYPKFATEGFTALYTRPPVVYVSAASDNDLSEHLCMQLGLPQSSICRVPCNTVFGSPHIMDVAAFERLFSDDVSCGKTPLLLVAYAGTPLAGHTDNLGRLRELCTQNGLWLHIEGDSLATVALHTIPPSLKVAPSSDSMTLNISRWFGLPGVPFCTFFRAKDPMLADAAGLNKAAIPERLTLLPLWTSMQYIGLDKMRELILTTVQLSQQLCFSLDSISSVKRIVQSHYMSPVVVFRYRAKPTRLPVKQSSHISEGTDDGGDDDDDQDGQDLSDSSTPEPDDVPASVRDALNRRLAIHLAEKVPNVVLDVLDVPKEGCCLRFNPLRSARACATTNSNIEEFCGHLNDEIASLDSSLLARDALQSALEDRNHIKSVETNDKATVGALVCIPQYWPKKTFEGLSEAKKQEINGLNSDILEKIAAEQPGVFSEGTTENGLICIKIEQVNPGANVADLVQLVSKTSAELEDSSKFIEQMSEMVLKGIEAAQHDIEKDSEEKLLEEGLLRHVPLVSSLYNWWSPPPKDEIGIKGRMFHLTSGQLETTEKTYKYHMQVQDDDEPTANPDSSPTKSGPTGGE